MIEVMDRAFSAWVETSFDSPQMEYLADALLAAGYRKADALLAERDALIHDIERAKASESSLLAELEEARAETDRRTKHDPAV